MSNRLLILGGSGLVGNFLIQKMYQKYDLFVTSNNNSPDFPEITNFQLNFFNDYIKLKELIQRIKPDVIINTVAHPSVDLCEENHSSADFLHVEITKKISSLCTQLNSKLIYLSTDAVFEGKLGKKYIETDITNPVNYYGQTKLKAENLVLAASKNNVVLRTAVIYGWHKKSRFSNWILDSLRANKQVDPHIDQYNTPTLVNDLAESIIQIIEKKIDGLFHATGKSCVNRYEFALILADKFHLDKNLIKPVTSLEKKQFAPRPSSTCLNSEKLENLLSFEFKDIHSGVLFILNESKKSRFN